MFKISFYIRKKSRFSNREFKDYWLGEHAELQNKYAEKLGVRTLIKCEVLPDDPAGQATMEAYGTSGELYDFVDHWVFNDIEDLKSGFANPQVLEAMQAVYASEDQYIDTHRSNIAMSVDLPQFYPIEEYRAQPGNGIIKIYYCVRSQPGITRAQSQLHWNACHGAVSRQDIRYSVLSKYIQAHTIDSSFVDEISALRGYLVEPNMIGHAEAWLDTEAAPKEFPQQEAAEVVAMSMDDIKLFADAKSSQVFAAKEHFIIDKPVITRPMPRFFSAVY
jgi:hypothetical protein